MRKCRLSCDVGEGLTAMESVLAGSVPISRIFFDNRFGLFECVGFYLWTRPKRLDLIFRGVCLMSRIS